MADPLVSTLNEFFTRILRHRDEWSGHDTGEWDIGYRGVKRTSHRLVPGAHWRAECNEESIFLSFQAAAPSYIEHRPNNDREWYFLGQHHGLPMRLLEWTESPLVALYFALTGDNGTCVSADPGDPPWVRVMDPANLDKATHRLGEAYLFVPDMKRLMQWLPTHCGRGKSVQNLPPDADFVDNSNPVAIFPVRYNARIAAQRGPFTIHGVNETAIDEVFRANASVDGSRIQKILIDPGACSGLLKDLRTMGLNQTSLFPEPSSVASDLIRAYGVR